MTSCEIHICHGLYFVSINFASFSGPLFQKTAPLDPGLDMPECDFEPEPYQVIAIFFHFFLFFSLFN